MPTGQSCPCGGRLGGCHPPLHWEPSSQWATSAGSAFPCSPRCLRAPTPSVPSHSPVPWADWRKGKKQNKTKTWPDPRPHCCLMPNYPESRLKSNSLSPEGCSSKGIALCPPSLRCTLVCLLLLGTGGCPGWALSPAGRQDPGPWGGGSLAWGLLHVPTGRQESLEHS